MTNNHHRFDDDDDDEVPGKVSALYRFVWWFGIVIALVLPEVLAKVVCGGVLWWCIVVVYCGDHRLCVTVTTYIHPPQGQHQRITEGHAKSTC